MKLFTIVAKTLGFRWNGMRIPSGWRVTLMILGSLLSLLGYVIPWEYVTYSPPRSFAARHPSFGSGYTALVSRSTLAGLVDSSQATELHLILYAAVIGLIIAFVTGIFNKSDKASDIGELLARGLDVLTTIYGYALLLLLGFIFRIIRYVEVDWQVYFVNVHNRSHGATLASAYVLATPFLGLLILAGGFTLLTVGTTLGDMEQVKDRKAFISLSITAVYSALFAFISYSLLSALPALLAL